MGGGGGHGLAVPRPGFQCQLCPRGSPGTLANGNTASSSLCYCKDYKEGVAQEACDWHRVRNERKCLVLLFLMRTGQVG